MYKRFRKYEHFQIKQRLRKTQSLVLCKYSIPGESQPFYFPLYHSPTTGSASVKIKVGKELHAIYF